MTVANFGVAVVLADRIGIALTAGAGLLAVALVLTLVVRTRPTATHPTTTEKVHA